MNVCINITTNQIASAFVEISNDNNMQMTSINVLSVIAIICLNISNNFPESLNFLVTNFNSTFTDVNFQNCTSAISQNCPSVKLVENPWFITVLCILCIGGILFIIGLIVACKFLSELRFCR